MYTEVVLTVATCGSGLARDEAIKNSRDQTDTKKNEAINPIPTNHTSDRSIAQSAR